MGWRENLNQNRWVTAAVAIAVTIAALGFLFFRFRTPAYVANNVYFYDLGTNKLFVAGGDQFPPIPAPSGNGKLGVRAYVYSCGDCKNAGTREVSYLEMYTPEAKNALANPDSTVSPIEVASQDAVVKGHMIRTPEQTEWVHDDNAALTKILAAARAKCGPSYKICEPDD